MKIYLQLLFSFWLLLFSIASSAQTWNWVSTVGTAVGADEVRDIVVDQLGNTYITGNYSGTIETPVDTIVSVGVQNIFVAKYDSVGSIVWIRSAGGGNGLDSGNALEIDDAGNIYVTGDIVGTSNFDTITVNLPTNQLGPFLAKYDNDGHIQWVRSGVFPQSFLFFNAAIDIAIDDFGDIYLVGQRFDQPISFGSITIPANNDDFSYLVKYDANGNELWGITPSSNSIPYAVKIFNNELYYFYGEFNNNWVKFKKFDLSGNTVLTSPTLLQYNSVPSFFSIEFEFASTGTITIFDEISSAVTVNNITYNSTNGNFILAQFDQGGVPLWSKQLSSLNSSFRGGMSLDTADNIYISSSFLNTITVDTFTRQAPDRGVFVAKLTPSGNAVWLWSAEGANNFSIAIDIAQDGDAYIAGVFSGTATFDENQIISGGSFDVYTAKLGCEPQRVSEVLGDTLVCLDIGSTTYQAIKQSVGNNFIWTISGGGVLTANNDVATVNWTQTGIHTITVAQVNECGAGEIFIFNVTVKDIPILPIINGDSTDCLGSATYNVTNNFDTDNYVWSVSGGGNLFPIGNTAIVNWAVSGDYVLDVVASNLCGVSPTGTLNIDIFEIPNQPSPIIGNSNVCQSTQTYTIPSVNNVDYTWSLSSGGTITSTDNIATINWTTAGTHTLSVIPFNECGIGSARSILVTVTEVPQQPSTVVGNLTVCKGLQSYSVIGNTTTSYNWTISGGGSLVASNNNATVNWQTVGTYTMTITPSNICGTGTPRTVTVTVLDVPSQPNEILGIDTVCIGTQNYSVAPQSGANFNWQLSSGGTVLPNNNLATINWTTPGTHTVTVTPSNSCGSGQAISRLIFVKNTNAQITTITGEDEPCLNIENYSVLNIGGLTYNWNVTGGGTITDLGNAAFVDWQNTGIYTLSVATSDGCTNSLTVSVEDVPTQPSQVFGDTIVCLGFYNYSILNQPDVNYTWTLSGGGILTQSGNAANVNWTQTGTHTLTATPSNDCGLGMPRSQTITVLDIPTQPSSIITTTVNDTLACLTTETYSVTTQPNLTYNWSLSGNGTLVQNNNSIDINWLTPSVDNEIIVTTSNLCGSSPQQSLSVDVLDNPQVAPIQGNTNVCLNTNQMYVVPLVIENNYNWTLSSGGILSIINDTAYVNWTQTGTHTLSIVPTNICGNGQNQTLQITVTDVPSQPVGFTGNLNACQTLEGYNVTAESGVNYNWSLSGGGSLLALSNAANVNWTISGTHTLTVLPTNQCGTGIPLNQTVTVQNLPTSPMAIIGIDSTCINTTDNFNITPQSGVTYNWSLSNGGNLNFNNNNATVNWNTTGTQILSVSAINTCGTSIPKTKTITVLDVPTSPTISGVTNVCLNDTEIYTAIGDGTSYTWSTAGGNVNGNNITWNTIGNQTLTVTPSNFCGSGQLATTTVLVETVPNVTQDISGDSVVCAGITAYSLPQITGVNYTWSISGGGSISALNNAANINWITPGIYTITAIPSNDCGNGNTITKQITVRDIPPTPVAIQGVDTSCTIQQTYIVNPDPDVTYLWSLGSGGVISPIGNSSIIIAWTDQGTHTLTITPIDACGTQGLPITKTITVLIPPQLSGDILGVEQVCNGTTEIYTLAGNIPNWTYDWTIGNGNSINSNGNQATVDFNTIGLTTLNVTVSNQCGIAPTKTLDILVENNAPSILGDISGDTLVCSNADAIYTISGSVDFDYNWILSDGGVISPLNNTSIVTWQTAGQYNLGVYPSNFCGIGDTLFTIIRVENPLERPSITLSNDALISSNLGVLSQWYFNGTPIENAITSTFIPMNQGIYTVESTNICGTTPLSNEFAFGLEGGFFAYPNPANDQVTLRIPSYLTWYTIDIINQNGSYMRPTISNTGFNEVPIDISGLAAGIYLLRVDTELLVFYRKLVVVR